MRYFLFIIVFFIGFSFALPGVVVGQDAGAGGPQFTILNPTSSITAGSPVTDAAGSPVDFIQTIFNVYKYAQLVAVALAAIMITLGGINIAVSGAIDRQAEGKDMIKSAIFGLVLLFGANLILRTINPALTNLTPPHVQSSVMRARKCAADEIDADNKPKTDCAVACPSGTNLLQARESGCTIFCEGDQVPKTSDCVLGLPRCTEGEKPEQFPPECYMARSGACNGPEATPEAKAQVLGCFPRQVEIPPKSFNLLDQENYLTYADCMDVRIGFPDLQHPCEFKNLGKEGWFQGLLNLSSKAISGKEAKNGLVVWRYPFYRYSYEKPTILAKSFEDAIQYIGSNPAIGAWPDQMQTGIETARCITYAYAAFDDNGMPQQWKRLPVPGNSFDDWKRCEIDFNDPKISQESSEQLGGLAVALPILTSSSQQEESGGGPGVQVYSEGLLSHQEAYNRLLAAGVNVWSSFTPDVLNNCKTAPPCKTNLEGIPGFVIDRLITIKRNCNCTVTVNGATEKEGHSKTTEHGPGHPVVDIAADTGVNGKKLGNYLIDNWEGLGVTKVLMNETLQKTFGGICNRTISAGSSSCNDPGEDHFHVVFGL